MTRLSKECRPHIPIIAVIEKNGLTDRLYHLIESQGTSVKALRKRLTEPAKREIFEKDDYQCQYCGIRDGYDGLVVDHIVALIEGGDNSEINLTTSCLLCNSKKHDDDVFEFIKKNDFTPLKNLYKKLYTLSKGLYTLKEEEKEKDKEKEEEVEKEEEKEKNPILNENMLVPEMFLTFKKVLTDYPAYVDKDFKPLLSIANFLHKQSGLNGNVVTNQKVIVQEWAKMCEIISKDNFYSTKPLSTISNSIQEIYQITKNGRKTSSNITKRNSTTTLNTGNVGAGSFGKL